MCNLSKFSFRKSYHLDISINLDNSSQLKSQRIKGSGGILFAHFLPQIVEIPRSNFAIKSD